MKSVITVLFVVVAAAAAVVVTAFPIHFPFHSFPPPFPVGENTGENNTPPTWKPFPGWGVSYTSIGTGNFGFSCGNRTSENLRTPATIAVDAVSHIISINVNNSVYTITDNMACITIPSEPGLAFIHHGWNYTDENNGYTQVRQMGLTSTGRQRWVGFAYDVGTCEQALSTYFETDEAGRMLVWAAYQTFNVDAQDGELDCSLTDFTAQKLIPGRPDPKLMVIPSACTDGYILDFCSAFKMNSPSFPYAPPYPGPDYVNPILLH